jgi:hypothetical protein
VDEVPKLEKLKKANEGEASLNISRPAEIL